MPTKIKILFVDDEISILDVNGLYLEMEGFDVTKASSGNEAIAILKESNYNFDIVVSDVKMADGDGIFLLEEVKKNNSEKPPVLLVSGFVEISKEECLEKGAIDLLCKPYDMDEIITLINKL